MPYAQDTITSADASNDFVNVLDGLLIDAGWTVVETLTPSGNLRNRVYKSAGVSNLCGFDWYLLVSWTTLGTANYVQVIGASEYNAGTHIASGLSGAPFGEIPSSSANNGGYKSGLPTTGLFSTTTRNMATFTVTSAPSTISSNYGNSGNQANNTYPGFQTLIDSSAFGYWMSVTLDHVALWTTVAANRQDAVISTLVMDAGYAASSLWNHKPIVTFSEAYFQMNAGIIGVAIDATHYTAVGAEFSGVFGSKLPALTDSYLAAFAWQPYVYFTYMEQGGSNTTPGTALFGGVVVGRVPDFYLAWGGSIGDTVEVDSATYVLTRPLLTAWPAVKRPTCLLLVE